LCFQYIWYVVGVLDWIKESLMASASGANTSDADTCVKSVEPEVDGVMHSVCARTPVLASKIPHEAESR
jgi:hypothetical protein